MSITNNYYTEESIIEIFSKHSLDDIVNTYSKNQLTQMYMTIYSSKPLSTYNKKQIVQRINNHFHYLRRAAAFNLKG